MTAGAPLEPSTEPAGAPLVAVRAVTCTFGQGAAAVAALVAVSLEVAAGEFFTLLGPSGCGKTTLLRIIAGFEHPDAAPPTPCGDVLIDGRSVLADPPNRRPVNTVFQSYALFPHMSVADNIGFGLANRGLRGAARRERVAAMLRLVQLDGMGARRPAALSGGQQQRVALARALAPAPRLLLLDEPLSALDPKLRRGMQVELKRIQRDTGIAFLLVTHDQEEALSLSDRIAVMEGGRISQVGTPADIFAHPRSRFVAEFMGASVLPGALVGTAARHVAVRPEHVAVRRAGTDRPTADTLHLPARVAGTVFGGARTSCTLVLDGGTLGAERDDLPSGLAAGDLVVCAIPRARIIALDD